MPTITVIDNPFVSLWYRTESQIVHHQIHKFVAGEKFREFLTAGLDILKKNQARKWLSDDRGNSVLAKDDLEWSEKNWAPQAAQAGWKYWAIVQPDKVLAQGAMDRLSAKYALLGVTAKTFTDPIDAMRWLENQP